MVFWDFFYVIINSLLLKFTGETDRYNYLCKATAKYLADEEAVSASNKARILELEEMNKNNEKKIEEIKEQIVDNVTVKYRKSFWKFKQTTFVEMVRILLIRFIYSQTMFKAY